MPGPTIRSILAPTGSVRELMKAAPAAARDAEVTEPCRLGRFSRRVQVEPWSGLVRLGSPYGGYVVPLGLVDENWICYSGGLGEDISFELELIEARGCSVFGFDPIPRAAAHAARVAGCNGRFRLYPLGLWSTDTTKRFFVPADADHVSHSIANLQRTEGHITAPCRSLPSLMRELGHKRIDLKLDVEGAEYEVLEPVLAGDLRVRVLCVDFHKIDSIEHMTQTLERLRRLSYRPYTFTVPM